MGTETKSSARQGKVVSKITKLVSDPTGSKAAASSKASGATAAPRKRSASKTTQAALTAEARLHFIETAAYYIAEKRGFCGGNPAEDWLQAEQQVDQQLLAG